MLPRAPSYHLASAVLGHCGEHTTYKLCYLESQKVLDTYFWLFPKEVAVLLLKKFHARLLMHNAEASLEESL